MSLRSPCTASAEDAKKAEAFLAGFTKQFGITLNLIGIPANSSVGLFQSVSTRLAGGLPLDSAYIATEGCCSRSVACSTRWTATLPRPVRLDAYYNDLDPHMLANFRQLDDLKGQPTFSDRLQRHVDLDQPPAFQGVRVPEPSPDWTWDDFLKAATGSPMPEPVRLRH